MAYTTIDDPSAYFQTLLYTGNGSASRALTNDGNSDLQPDWLWIKKRNADRSHTLTDSSRGLTKYNEADDNGAEGTFTDKVLSVQSDGFTVGDNSSVNASSDTYVAWQWIANGGTTASNTDGSITSTVQANTTAGFSIVSYTGTGSNATVGHGLGVAPKMVIVKSRSGAYDWLVYHNSIGNGKAVKLNTTDAQLTSSVYWNSTSPTSSVFSLGTSTAGNSSSATQIAYCFAEKKGYSKFGKFTGNNNADGAFVYLGFKPSWIMTKSSNQGGANYDWVIFDNKRNTFNVSDAYIDANLSAAEVTSGRNEVDFLSNGFKCRSSYGDLNSNTDYIYFAFAESPFVNSNGIPTNAR